MRRTPVPVPAFEVEGERDALSASAGSSSSSPSGIASSAIRREPLLDFVPDFWDAEGVPLTLCFLGTVVVSSSTGVYFVLRRFRFPREGSSATRKLRFEVREIAGESVARPLDISEFLELLELLSVGLLEADIADARDLFGVLGADAAVSIGLKAERIRAHLDGYISSSRPSLLPKPLRGPQLPQSF